MKHISSKIITQIIIYTLVIIGIFAIQFTKGKTFSFVIGSMSVSGRYDTPKNGITEPMLPIHIVSNGINFYATEQQPITANIDNTDVELEIKAYQNNNTSFTIQCNYDINITFSSDKRGDIDTVSIKTILPKNVKYIKIPWKTTQTAKLERKEGNSYIKHEKIFFEFIGDFGFNQYGIIDTKAPTPILTLNSNNLNAKYKTYIPKKGINLATISNLKQSNIESFNESKEHFSKTAMNSFNAAINQNKYNEKMIASYLAEMGRKNMYISGINRIKASDISQENRSWLSMPFYGNLIEEYNSLLETEKSERSYLSKLIANKNISIFEFDNLITYLIDRNSEMMIDDLETVITANEISTINMAQSLGILEASLDYHEYFPNRDNIFEKLTDTCSRNIQESLLLMDEELYITNDNTTIDTILTFRAVRILLKYGKTHPQWLPIAYKLYTSIMEFSGESARLPASFNITENKIHKSIIINDKIIYSPEELYYYAMPNNTWYPHSQSLSTDIAHGTWIWTIAEKIETNNSNNKQVSFNIHLVEGGIHYMVIRNIPPFHTIQIHEVDFRTDPKFEMYNSSGYIYDEKTKTLYLKLKHKKDIETINLFFK